MPRWPDYREQALAGDFDARPGLLGDTLATGSRTVAAIGPGALIAAADSRGRVAHAWPGLPAGGFSARRYATRSISSCTLRESLKDGIFELPSAAYSVAFTPDGEDEKVSGTSV